MSWFGKKVAEAHGATLPTFRSQADAELQLFQERDARLNRILDIAQRSGGRFSADFTPGSLKGLEAFYFALHDENRFEDIGITREEFERVMFAYLGEIAVRNKPGAHWVVAPFAFAPGRYQIGITSGLFSVMGQPFLDHYKAPTNKRRDKMFRDYKKWFM